MGRLITPDDWRMGESWYEFRCRQVRNEKRRHRLAVIGGFVAFMFVLYCALWVACGGGQP